MKNIKDTGKIENNRKGREEWICNDKQMKK